MASVPPILSLTETQAFSAMRSFLLAICLQSDPAQPVQVVRGQAGINRVAEPSCPDFIVMSPLRQTRLAYNRTSYIDNVLTGSIVGTTLTVTAISQYEGPLIAGTLLIDGIWPTMNVAANTVIVAQLSGTVGGIGTYTVSPSQTLASEVLYAGLREDLAPTELTIQLDVHGPKSGDNSVIIDTLFRSEYGVDAFEDALVAEGAPDWSVVPLYCDIRGQVPFVNENAQVEYRWVIDACMQISPVVSTPQQFAGQVVVNTLLIHPDINAVLLANDTGNVILINNSDVWLRPG